MVRSLRTAHSGTYRNCRPTPWSPGKRARVICDLRQSSPVFQEKLCIHKLPVCADSGFRSISIDFFYIGWTPDTFLGGEPVDAVVQPDPVACQMQGAQEKTIWQPNESTFRFKAAFGFQVRVTTRYPEKVVERRRVIIVTDHSFQMKAFFHCLPVSTQ
jgi:ribosomal protein L34